MDGENHVWLQNLIILRHQYFSNSIVVNGMRFVHMADSIMCNQIDI